MSAPTLQPGIPKLPEGARDLLRYEDGSMFLGWTCYTLSRFTRRITWYFIRPQDGEAVRCASNREAMNSLRGPAGLTALVTEDD